ncbi:uncharacterized protein LOC128237292 [Mya arenaria]|uniref:uncharacterized protein LOC128237292 n=1 Tax=Mya arenaria TaxID=6604 RepID=UPI0022E89073|nr:uncharacterized protein LOC128237292 [Mya arenaria]
MDEVPGKKILQADASDLDVTYCQPCSQDGESFAVDAYCTVCKKFMCSPCTNVHRKQSVSKYHALLDKSILPTSVRDCFTKEEGTESCDFHPRNFIKFFCPTHQSLNCKQCLDFEHRSCKVNLISDISKTFKQGKEYGQVNEVIAQLLKNVDDIDSDVEDSIQLVKMLSQNEITKLRKYRNIVNKYLDEREEALIKTISRMKNTDETLLNSLKLKLNCLKIDVKTIKENLTAKEDSTNQLFIEAYKATNMLEDLQTALAEINKEKTRHQYQFRKDPATDRLLTFMTCLGTVEEIVDAQALDQRRERVYYTTQDKGTMNTSKSDVATSIHTVGDIEAVETTEDVSIKTAATELNPGVKHTLQYIHKYRYPDEAKTDVFTALRTFTDLRPKLEEFVFNDGTMQTLLQLHGTIPVTYNRNPFNIPICVWLLDTHPYDPPMVFVKPTTTMLIKSGRYVDINGAVDLPYIEEWQYPDSNLCGMIQVLTIVFGEEPPVFSNVKPLRDT